ncbi:hypothetical protein [Paraglaciecola hydrolytica]|uniref:hypothetical protein n=1 Tax=Paraglaciecola hydrolytica TaxID=1799789 RepID=UPI000AA994DD|nr:hypothetical protein [Paraglaciecola hydrolytica]
MLLVYFLVFSIFVLLAFSLSKETGKNTKHARKGANVIADNPRLHRSIGPSKVIEIN